MRVKKNDIINDEDNKNKQAITATTKRQCLNSRLSLPGQCILTAEVKLNEKPGKGNLTRNSTGRQAMAAQGRLCGQRNGGLE